MRRDPVLHIKLSHLEEILNGINYTSRTTGHKLANMLLDAAQPYQITDRHLDILKLNANTKKKVTRSMDADSVDYGMVEKVNLMIMDVRKRNAPRSKVRGILKGSRQYLLLKEITKIAVDFSEHFEITPKSEGVREFIEMGIGFMGKYGLNRFKTYEERIYEAFESKLTVINDEDKESTREYYAIWQKAMMVYSGVEELTNIDKDLVKFSHIVHARLAADKHDVDYEDWVEAQFSGLAFLDAIPEINQFYGEGAKTRYDRYQNSQVDTKESDSDDLVALYGKK